MRYRDRWIAGDPLAAYVPELDGLTLRAECRKVSDRALSLRQESTAIRERSLELCRLAQSVLDRSRLLHQGMQGADDPCPAEGGSAVDGVPSHSL